MVFIYILRLEQDKYYIGKTKNPTFRVEQHFASSGSMWTKKYKPLNVFEIIADCDDYDEDKYTIKYMETYGINNVRGGSFCEIKLSNKNKITLKQMIKGTNNKCYICGSESHFARECKIKSTKESVPMINVKEKCDCPTSYFAPHRRGKCLLNKIIACFDNEYDDIESLIIEDADISKPIVVVNDGSCFRCGRKGHYVSQCYASTHITGNKLTNRTISTKD
jgi:hypothetical protein